MDLEDGTSWILKGEGKVGAVFHYKGSNAYLRGRVLRVRKLAESNPAASDPAMSRLQAQIWASVPGLADNDGTIREDVYQEQIMRPLLGAAMGEYVIVSIPFKLSDGLLGQLKRMGRQPPPSQLAETAALMQDYTLLSPDRSPPETFEMSLSEGFKSENSSNAQQTGERRDDGVGHGPTFCIEIKPKCGFLPNSAAIHPANSVKKRISRYTLHQTLKLRQGKIIRPTQYDPLDLFSGDHSRCSRAISSLLFEPQNNLTAFIDGLAVSVEAIVAKIASFRSISSTDCHQMLSEVIASILQRSGVLDQILDVQKLDEYDIEGVYMVYKSLSTDHGVNLEDSYRVLSSNDESTSKGPKQEATFALQSLSNKARIEIIKNYLIAATAKDCSIMLAFCLGNVSCEPPLSKLSFHYTICVADLDFKQLSKICEHHQLDCEIVRCFLSKS